MRKVVCDIIAYFTHRPVLVHYGILVHEGNIVTVKGGITHELMANALYMYTCPTLSECDVLTTYPDNQYWITNTS